MRLEYQIDREVVLSEFLRSCGISRRMGKKIKSWGQVMVNGEPVCFNAVLQPGDILTIAYQEVINDKIPPAPFSLNIIYEDEWLLVISKPADLSVQPSRKHRDDNLASRIAHYYQQTGRPGNIHIVNRLDYATSGLLSVARDGNTHHLLASQPQEKRYLAVVKGLPAPAGIINRPIAREPGSAIKREISADGAPAVTEYRVLSAGRKRALVELALMTGRTHQIRLHMASIDHPIIGDRLYGEGGERLLLHAYYLAFDHPYTGRRMEFVDYPNWYENDIENDQKLCYNDCKNNNGE